ILFILNFFSSELDLLSFGFFFSSRRRHTRSKRDWSQTCALPIYQRLGRALPDDRRRPDRRQAQRRRLLLGHPLRGDGLDGRRTRSEERRVGKACSTGVSPYAVQQED